MIKKLIVLFAFVALTLCQYDESQGQEYWYLSTASYCRDSKIQQWNCGKVCDKVPKITEVTLFKNSTGDNAGFAGFSAARNQIVVVFRGTLPWLIKNWIDDINFFKTDFPNCGGCQVHQGFYKSYLDLQSQVRSAVRGLKSNHLFAKILVTGHSLGGALAHHALIDLIRNGFTIDNFYTYGSPRVGDDKFKVFIQQFYRNFKARVVHSHDPVPHLPMIVQGFSHSSNEVYYIKHLLKPETYQVCNDEVAEDPQCANSNLVDLNIDDHTHYFDIDQIIEIPLCQ